MAGLIWWLWIFEPGKGPQGGEFAAGMLLMFLLAWTLIGFVDVMLVAGLSHSGFSRFIKAGLLWLVGWVVVGWLLYSLSNLAASESAGSAARRLGLFGFLLVTLALQWVNLSILARVHRR